MSEQEAMNGAESPIVEPNALQGQQMAAQFLTAMCSHDAQRDIVGVVQSMQGYVPRVVVAAYVRCLGAFVAGMFSGELQDVLVARGMCRKAFIEGFDSVKPNSGLIVPAPQMTAPPPNMRG